MSGASPAGCRTPRSRSAHWADALPDSGPAFVVHALAHVRAALAAAAARGSPVTLLSAPGAGGFAGAGWFMGVIDQARAAHPQVTLSALLDCGDRPGFVLAALRQGVPGVIFTGPAATAVRLADIAAQQGARLLTARPPACDLLDAVDPERACRAWLDVSAGAQG
jgi:hypothetical protein